MSHWLRSIKIEGYRPFREAHVPLGRLEVIAGANGSGKSSLLEFLRFLRDAMHSEIPPEIVAGATGQQVFHAGGPNRFRWKLEMETEGASPLVYRGELTGPIGQTRISNESVETAQPEGDGAPAALLEKIKERLGVVTEGGMRMTREASGKAARLALGAVSNPEHETLYRLREYIRSWRFYSSFGIDDEAIRRSVPVEQEPVLREDAANLNAVLHYLMTEHRSTFDELEHHLRMVVPGFKGLTVKARGGPGEVIAFWKEGGIDDELRLSDLSDGTLRLICWVALAVQPNPPTLVCIDEPAQGVHPRTLPVLAGLFEKMAERTQVLLATHSSYFLSQFDVSDVAVMRKEDGAARFLKPKDSDALRHSLEDFGAQELEGMHRSDELERLA